MTGIAFIDTETTGLDPDRHEVWEVAAIVDGEEWAWFLPVFDLGAADARALDIGGFRERYPKMNGHVTLMADFVRQFSNLTWGRHLCGAVVSFDEERLRRLLRANGACPGWHYHLIDVEAMAVGYLRARFEMGDHNALPDGGTLPWKSVDLSRAIGVEPNDFEAHTALGDARWVKAMYEAMMGIQPGTPPLR